MGCWDWDNVKAELGSIADAPAPVKLAASIVPVEFLDEVYEAEVHSKTGLEQLSLIEWSVCDEVISLFKLLRQSGSRVGYSVDQGAGYLPADQFRKFELSDENAQVIANELSMELPMAFIDDQSLCSLVSFHSDYALIGLRPDLFEKWLEANPLDLTIWSDEPRWPEANCLSQARTLADRRRVAWREFMRNGRAT